MWRANSSMLKVGNHSGLRSSRYPTEATPWQCDPIILVVKREASDEIEVEGNVSVTELTGSETFVHFSMEDNPWVALLHDVQDFAVASTVKFYLKPQHLLLFDSNDALVEWQLGNK